MSSCWALIPVKSLGEAKSRLSGSLTHQQRTDLCLEMLQRVLAAVAEAGDIMPVVVSEDRLVRSLAEATGVRTLADRWDGLNASLDGAARWCLEQGASSLLVVHADLPLLKGEDLQAMITLGQAKRSVVIAPCRRNEGTNAMLLRPLGIIPFAFGPGSFEAHAGLARERGLPVNVYRSPTVALDIDTDEDLGTFRSAELLCRGADV